LVWVNSKTFFWKNIQELQKNTNKNLGGVVFGSGKIRKKTKEKLVLFFGYRTVQYFCFWLLA